MPKMHRVPFEKPNMLSIVNTQSNGGQFYREVLCPAKPPVELHSQEGMWSRQTENQFCTPRRSKTRSSRPWRWILAFVSVKCFKRIDSGSGGHATSERACQENPKRSLPKQGDQTSATCWVPRVHVPSYTGASEVRRQKGNKSF